MAGLYCQPDRLVFNRQWNLESRWPKVLDFFLPSLRPYNYSWTCFGKRVLLLIINFFLHYTTFTNFFCFFSVQFWFLMENKSLHAVFLIHLWLDIWNYEKILFNNPPRNPNICAYRNISWLQISTFLESSIKHRSWTVPTSYIQTDL